MARSTHCGPLPQQYFAGQHSGTASITICSYSRNHGKKRAWTLLCRRFAFAISCSARWDVFPQAYWFTTTQEDRMAQPTSPDNAMAGAYS